MILATLEKDSDDYKWSVDANHPRFVRRMQAVRWASVHYPNNDTIYFERTMYFIHFQDAVTFWLRWG